MFRYKRAGFPFWYDSYHQHNLHMFSMIQRHSVPNSRYFFFVTCVLRTGSFSSSCFCLLFTCSQHVLGWTSRQIEHSSFSRVWMLLSFSLLCTYQKETYGDIVDLRTDDPSRRSHISLKHLGLWYMHKRINAKNMDSFRCETIVLDTSILVH